MIAPASVAGDLVATYAKAQRVGIAGGGQGYASGLNYIGRRIGQAFGSPALTGALVAVGDVATPVLAVTGSFISGYNATIIAECLLGVIE